MDSIMIGHAGKPWPVAVEVLGNGGKSGKNQSLPQSQVDRRRHLTRILSQTG